MAFWAISLSSVSAATSAAIFPVMDTADEVAIRVSDIGTFADVRRGTKAGASLGRRTKRA